MNTPDTIPEQFYDNDQVLMGDGRICRVIGNVAAGDTFIGFSLYKPDPSGERNFRGQPYTRSRVEDPPRPYKDALQAYRAEPHNEVIEHFDAMRAAQEGHTSFEGTIWHDLYEELVNIFGKETVGVLGSALPGLHVDAAGKVKNDVDFFIEGLENVPKLAQHLIEIRQKLGFTEYSPEAEAKIRGGWERVFVNPANSYDAIMARRWSGMQIQRAGQIVLNTFRFRDKRIETPVEAVDPKRLIAKNVSITGTALGTDRANLWPRTFTLESGTRRYPIYFLWWKFCSPVREHDQVTLCGDIVDINSTEALRITDYEDHSIHIHEN